VHRRLWQGYARFETPTDCRKTCFGNHRIRSAGDRDPSPIRPPDGAGLFVRSGRGSKAALRWTTEELAERGGLTSPMKAL
jgi:hypothetical protein